MEIEISKRTAIGTLIVLLAMTTGLIGYSVSPRDRAGRPVLLLPNVRAVEEYRRSATAWTAKWRTLDVNLRAILKSSETADLLATSQDAQQAFEQALALAREVDAAESPAPLIGLHDQAVAAALAYVDAGIAVARWVSAPSAENRIAAEQTAVRAGQTLEVLEANEWISRKGSR